MKHFSILKPTVLFISVLIVQATYAQDWTWMHGANVQGTIGNYGTQGVAAPTNTPGARWGVAHWKDPNGNFLIFGGMGHPGPFNPPGPFWLNDFWKYDITINQWTWLKGPTSGNGLATYGTIGVSSVSNYPGARQGTSRWTDANGNLWMFGGYGYATSSTTIGTLNDLWKYDINTSQWTWIKGTNVNNNPGSYGTQGVAASSNLPPARAGATSFTDNNGNFWLFGGTSYAFSSAGAQLSDLWKYNIATNQWTWMNGPNLLNQGGVYGTLGVGAPANVPCARMTMGWTDNSGNFWIFGGYTYTNSTAFILNDLWKYTVSSNLWAWMSGSNTFNAIGSYGTMGVPAASNMPGARSDVVTWKDLSGNFWLFGGDQQSSSTLNGSDLWKYDLTSSQWTWMKGPNTPGNFGIYGSLGTPAASNNPGCRNGAVSWTDNLGNFWMFGGGGYSATDGGHLSDMWRYGSCALPTGPVNTTPPANQTVCAGSSATLSMNGGTNTVRWFLSLSSNTIVANGQGYVTSSLTVGTYTFYADAFSCGSSLLKTPVTVTALPGPVLAISSLPASVCSGETLSLSATGATSYTWSNGSFTPATTMLLLSNTTITLTGKDVNGCLSTALLTKTVNLCSGIAEAENSCGLLFSPNPVEGTIHVFSPGALKYTLTDLKGAVIQAGIFHDGDNTVDLYNQPGGIYIIRANNAEKNWTIKFVRQ